MHAFFVKQCVFKLCRRASTRKFACARVEANIFTDSIFSPYIKVAYILSALYCDQRVLLNQATAQTACLPAPQRNKLQ